MRDTALPTNCSGRHFIADFWGARHLDDAAIIEQAMRDAAAAAGAVLLNVALHEFTENNGITGVAMLAESHISVHTWPERGYAAFDVFMCGAAQPEKAVAHLKTVFQPEYTDVQEIRRGEQSATDGDRHTASAR